MFQWSNHDWSTGNSGWSRVYGLVGNAWYWQPRTASTESGPLANGEMTTWNPQTCLYPINVIKTENTRWKRTEVEFCMLLKDRLYPPMKEMSVFTLHFLIKMISSICTNDFQPFSSHSTHKVITESPWHTHTT